MGAAAMIKHEAHCTSNPNRNCGMCGWQRHIGEIVVELKKRFTLFINEDTYEQSCEWTGDKITLEEIRNLVDGCPVCILAIFRQTKLFYECCKLEKFDYKKEAEEAMVDKNRSYNYGNTNF